MRNDYTSISLTPKTKQRLEQQKKARGEYWDDVINRVLDTVEKVKVGA